MLKHGGGGGGGDLGRNASILGQCGTSSALMFTFHVKFLNRVEVFLKDS